MSLQLQTLSSDRTTLTDEALDDLRLGFRGALISPDDATYDQACVVQNGMFHRRPGLIMRCSGTADVVDAVKLAGENDLLLAVRAGGHSIAGHSVCDGGLLVDLSGMRGVWVDPVRRIVRVQGGATWSDVDRETQLFGLAVPGGVVSTTGVAGLTLGGGIGWLHRKYGLTCDNLRAAEVVTADGEVLRADESEHSELLWGLRGGGGNFGVVTTFEFDAHPVGPLVWSGVAMYAAEDAERVVPEWRSWAATLSDDVTTRAMLWHMPEDPRLPPSVHDKEVLITAGIHAGSVDDGEKSLAPVPRFAEPLADLSGPMPYCTVQSLLDWMLPKGAFHSYWKSIYLRDLDDDAIGMIIRRGRERPHPMVLVHVPLLAGAIQRVGAADTAFGDRDADFMLSVDGNWPDAGDTARVKSWVRDTIAEASLLSSAGGTYLNFSGDTDLEGVDRQAAYGENLQRLMRLKAEYDPANRFRLNNNIAPAA